MIDQKHDQIIATAGYLTPTRLKQFGNLFHDIFTMIQHTAYFTTSIFYVKVLATWRLALPAAWEPYPKYICWALWIHSSSTKSSDKVVKKEDANIGDPYQSTLDKKPWAIWWYFEELSHLLKWYLQLLRLPKVKPAKSEEWESLIHLTCVKLTNQRR
jgi:hypothetical protein